MELWPGTWTYFYAHEPKFLKVRDACFSCANEPGTVVAGGWKPVLFVPKLLIDARDGAGSRTDC